VLAGLTTFMVMAYIIFVNPAILSFASVKELQGQGPPFGPTVAATCLVAALMTAVMGLCANYPLVYTFIKLVRGRGAAVHPMMYLAATAFVVHFLWR
jgi:xanthine/uracil/vitamin C permease (AzgA family)